MTTYKRVFFWGCFFWLFIMMLGGCANPTRETYAAAKACDVENPDDPAVCKPLWDEWNLYEDKLAKKHNAGKCPNGMVLWIDDGVGSCVTQADAKDAIRRIMQRY